MRAKGASPRSFWAEPHIVAIILVLAATVVRQVFLQGLGTGFVFITFYPAVMLAALYGGLRAGMLATLLSAAAADYFWMEPLGSFLIVRSMDGVAMAVFVASGTLMSGVAEKLRQSTDRLRRMEETQRRKLESQVAERSALLRESEERLAAALRVGKLGVYDYNPRSGQLKWDATVYRLFGVQEGEPVTFETFEAGVHPEDLAAVRTAIEKAVGTGSNHHYECEYRAISRADGTVRWIFKDGSVTFDADGPCRLVGTVQDITERKLAQAALRESEERERQKRRQLETILAAIPAGVFIAEDPTCSRISANRAGERLLRVPQNANTSKSAPEGIAPQNWELLSHGRMLAPHELPIQRAIATKSVIQAAEYEVRYAEGDSTFILGNALPLLDDFGEVLGAVGAFLDISERKKAEDALSASEERLRAIVDTAVDAIIVIDEEGLIQSVNPATERILGYSPGEIVGKNVSLLVPGAEAAVHDKYIATYLRTGKAKIIGIGREVDHRRKDGSVFTADLAVSEWRVGGKRYFTGTIRDITERKRHDKELQLLLREVNHRAKNMLAVVQAIARQTAATTPDQFLERFGERVRALGASQDLLVKNEWRGVELDELIRSQLAHFKDLIGTRIDLKGGPLFVSASAAQTIGMAIHELATNAGKYGALSNSEGRLEVDWHLEYTEMNGETFVMSWVERGEAIVTPPTERGFGTTVIVPMARMSLDAEVDLDYAKTGLIWRLRCPAVRVLQGKVAASPAKNLRPLNEGASSGGRRSILVVEDEILIALDITQILAGAGFDAVGPANSVAQALELIRRDGCEAAVLDVNLGGETSERVALELKERGRPFLTLSGYSREQHPAAFSGAPALTKPLQPELFVTEVRRLLDTERTDERTA
jgi:PAS domain S-box-containing protein